jgi:endonuclease III
MRAAGRRAGTTRWARWPRALRRLFAPFDVVDLHVHRHPSRHSVVRAHREAERRAARAPVTPLDLEQTFEDLLEEWGRSA